MSDGDVAATGMPMMHETDAVIFSAGGSLPPALLSLMSIADQAARRDALKQQMALAAQHLLAEPDKHVGPGLRLLLGCAADR